MGCTRHAELVSASLKKCEGMLKQVQHDGRMTGGSYFTGTRRMVHKEFGPISNPCLLIFD